MSKKLNSALSVFAKYMDVSNISPTEVKATEDHKKLELEAIEYSMDVDGHSHWKHKLRIERCKQCSKQFQTNHCAVRYCSIKCLSESLNAKGITFQNVKSDYEPPLVVSGETTEYLEKWAKAFLKALDEKRMDEVVNVSYNSAETPEEHPQYHQDTISEEHYQASDSDLSLLDNLIEEDSFFDTL